MLQLLKSAVDTRPLLAELHPALRPVLSPLRGNDSPESRQHYEQELLGIRRLHRREIGTNGAIRMSS